MTKRVTNYELKEIIEKQGDKLDKINNLLFGINGEPGVVERVRTLERFAANWRKFIWAVVVAAIGVISAILIGG